MDATFDLRDSHCPMQTNEVFLNSLLKWQFQPLHQLTRVIIIIQPMNCGHTISATLQMTIMSCDVTSHP